MEVSSIGIIVFTTIFSSVLGLVVWVLKKYIARRVISEFEHKFKDIQRKLQREHEVQIEAIRAENALRLEALKTHGAKELAAAKQQFAISIKRANEEARRNLRAYWVFHPYFDLVQEVSCHKFLLNTQSNLKLGEIHAELLALVRTQQWQKIREIAKKADADSEREFFHLPDSLGLRIAEFKLLLTKFCVNESFDQRAWEAIEREIVEISAALAALAKDSEELQSSTGST